MLIGCKIDMNLKKLKLIEEVKIDRNIETLWKDLESGLKREKGITSETANGQGNKLRF